MSGSSISIGINSSMLRSTNFVTSLRTLSIFLNKKTTQKQVFKNFWVSNLYENRAIWEMYLITTVADWDSMGRVITQTRTQAFQTLGWAFSFLLSPQKPGWVFQKHGWAFQKLGPMFWNKCSPESFDQRTH